MDKMKKNQWLPAMAIVFMAAALIYLLNGIFSAGGSKEVSYSDFLAEVRAGHLAEVQITEKNLIGVLKEEKAEPGKAPVARRLTATRLPGMDETALLKEL